MTAPSEARWRCPTCGARVGQRCNTPDGEPHAERVKLANDPVAQRVEAKVDKAIARAKREKRADPSIPTAFESNRRRH